MNMVVVLAVAGPAHAQDAKPKVEYGQVDAATVRVFSIGNVDLEKVPTRDHKTVAIAKPKAGHGTGFLVGGGMVVTAQHVVDGARHIVIRLPGEKGFYAARLLHEDKQEDVAVLDIEVSDPGLQLADDVSLKVRQTVFAVGYPLDPTRTQAQSARGIVAGQKDDDTIQLDMALNPGNSGGPLLDEQDRVVGMVVARGDPEKGVQGIGFAVSVDRLRATVKEAQRRLDAGEIAALAADKKVSAVVVDELVQKGVFHEIREMADIKKELRTVDVQRALDSLIARTNDADLLAFVGAQLWNVYVALWAAGDDDLREAEISRAQASALAKSFGTTAGVACRKAKKLDPDVAHRSPIVDVVIRTWPDPGTARVSRRARDEIEDDEQAGTTLKTSTPWRWPSWHLDFAPRAAGQLRVNPESGSVGMGWGIGLGIAMNEQAFRLGPIRFVPMLGGAWGTAKLIDDMDATVTHSYLTFEVGLIAEVWRCGSRRTEIAAAYAPGRYSIDVDAGEAAPSSKSTETSVATYAHGRFSAGYRWGHVHVGLAVHVFDGPTFWFEPAVLSAVF
jgi:hypothetical protein